jgi:poly(beta-D-mannuronate) lyase
VVDGLVFSGGTQTEDHLIAFRESSTILATNCRVSNCVITNYPPAIAGQDTKWVSLFGLSNRVDHCYFAGKTNPGTLLVVWLPDNAPQTPNYHLIDHNRFGPRPPLGKNGAETIRVGDSSRSFNISHTIVEANLFQECNGEVEIISNKSCENVYRGNTFLDCEGALTLRHGNRCTVEGNFFFGHNKPHTGGVRIIGEDHKVFNNYFADLSGTGTRSALTFMLALTNSPLNGYFQVKRAVVAFNTFVNCAASLRIGLATTYDETGEVTSMPPTDCVIANNVVLSRRDDLVDQRVVPPNMLWEGNIMYGNNLGITTNNGIQWIDPKLGLATNGFWRPAATSPVKGAARGSYSYVTNDIDGQLRPVHQRCWL